MSNDPPTDLVDALEVLTEEDGTFCLPPGAYTIRMTADGPHTMSDLFNSARDQIEVRRLTEQMKGR